MLKPKIVKKKKASHPAIKAYITSTSNNTRFTATTPKGDVIARASAGSIGYTGTKRSTPNSASEAAINFIDQIKGFNIKECTLILKGLFPGRDAALKTISASNLPVKAIFDITPVAHGGCRRPGRRRV